MDLSSSYIASCILLVFWPDDFDVLDHHRPDRTVGLHVSAGLRNPLHQLDAAHVALSEDHVAGSLRHSISAAIAALVAHAHLAGRIRLLGDEELARAGVRARVGISEPPRAVEF